MPTVWHPTLQGFWRQLRGDSLRPVRMNHVYPLEFISPPRRRIPGVVCRCATRDQNGFECSHSKRYLVLSIPGMGRDLPSDKSDSPAGFLIDRVLRFAQAFTIAHLRSRIAGMERGISRLRFRCGTGYGVIAEAVLELRADNTEKFLENGSANSSLRSGPIEGKPTYRSLDTASLQTEA